MKEQRSITKRIVIFIKGKKNVTDQTIMALRIPYKLTDEQQVKAKKGEKEEKKAFGISVEEWPQLDMQSDAEEVKVREIKEKVEISSLATLVKKEEEDQEYYEAIGSVFKVKFQGQGLEVQVDINLFSPLDSKVPQNLPQDPSLYQEMLEYAIIDEVTNKRKAAELLKDFCNLHKNVSTELLR